MSIRKQIISLIGLLMTVPCSSWAQDDAFSLLQKREERTVSSINRKDLVRRHNPQATHVGQQKFLLGDGRMFFKVDATALQTFISDPQLPLNIGLNITDTTRLTRLAMSLDRWSGKAESRFRYNGQYYHVETVCSPVNQFNWQMARPTFSTRITSDSVFEVAFKPVQLITDGRNIDETKLSVTTLKHHAAVRLVNTSDKTNTFQWFTFSWRGNVSLKKRGNLIILRCKGQNTTIEGEKKKAYSLDITMTRSTSMPSDAFFNNENVPPFTDYALLTSSGWNNFWTETGIAEFSAEQTSAEENAQAQQVEQKLIEALYNVIAATPDDWWLQAPLTAYGFAKQLTPAFKREMRNNPEPFCQRPELIAAALLTLRAYTHPDVAARFDMSDDLVNEFCTTILNAYAPWVEKAADNLAAGRSHTPGCLDSKQLLDVAGLWTATSDSLKKTVEISSAEAKERSWPFPPGGDRWFPLKRQPEAGPTLFRLPMVTEFLNNPAPTLPQQQQLLFSVAARRWPENWNVRIENILPLP